MRANGHIGDGKCGEFGEVVSSEIFNDTGRLVIAFVFVGQGDGVTGRDGSCEVERGCVAVGVDGNAGGFDPPASFFDDEVVETRNGVGNVLVEADAELITINDG